MITNRLFWKVLDRDGKVVSVELPLFNTIPQPQNDRFPDGYYVVTIDAGDVVREISSDEDTK